MSIKLLMVIGLLLILAFVLWGMFNKPCGKKNIQSVLFGVRPQNNRMGDGNELAILYGPPRPTLYGTLFKNQNIDDVEGNDEYMSIEVEEFCEQSSVSRIYVKNTCINEIYRFFFENNNDKSKVNGCFVLGRWVWQPERRQYMITMEHVVEDSDGAVLSEGVLIFGPKIKIRTRTMLRMLRKESNLQYDVTCWVRSNPGSGVSFSNADNELQNGFKNPIMAHFHIAIIIDTLTPDQEFGIFTFRHDGKMSIKTDACNESDKNARENLPADLPMNNEDDLKRLFSLTEWHKWALQNRG